MPTKLLYKAITPIYDILMLVGCYFKRSPDAIPAPLSSMGLSHRRVQSARKLKNNNQGILMHNTDLS